MTRATSSAWHRPRRDLHAFVWTAASGIVDLDGRANRYSEAWALNANNIVVGLQETDTSPLPPFTTRTFRAFVSAPNTSSPGTRIKTELGTLGGQDSVAYGINATAQIVGAAQTAAQREHGVLWTLNTQSQYVITDLGVLPTGAWSYGFALNDSGRAVGVAQFNQATNTFHAVRWDPTTTGVTITDLGTLAGGQGVNSEALAVNAGGLIVGWSSINPQDTVRHAFIYQNTTMTDLNTLISTSSPGWVLLRADGINTQGQIIGQGLLNGVPRLFVATPS